MRTLASALICFLSVPALPQDVPSNAAAPMANPRILYPECPKGPNAERLQGGGWCMTDAKADQIACELLTCEDNLLHGGAGLSKIQYGPGWVFWASSLLLVAVAAATAAHYAWPR